MPMFNMRGARRPMQPPMAPEMGGVIDTQAGQPQGIFGQAFGGLGRFNERNPMMLAALGRVISGDDPYPVIQAGMAMKKDRRAEQKTAAQENATKALAKRMGYADDEIEAYAAAGRLGDLMKPDNSAKIREGLLAKGVPEAEVDGIIAAGAADQYFKPQKGAGDVDYSQVPVYGVDPKTGKTGIGVLGDDGTFKPIDTGGFEVAGGMDKIDAGTEWLIYDNRTHQLVDRVPKQNYQEAFDTAKGGAEGKGAGEAAEAQRSIGSKMPGLEQVVTTLDDLAGKATYTMTGQGIDWANKQLGLEPREAAVARAQYIAIVDNQVLPLMRDTFGAAFTQKEGETLRATLGDPDKSPAEKQAVLKAFIEQKRRDVEALESRTGQGGQQPPAGGGGADSYKQKYGLD